MYVCMYVYIYIYTHVILINNNTNNTNNTPTLQSADLPGHLDAALAHLEGLPDRGALYMYILLYIFRIYESMTSLFY